MNFHVDWNAALASVNGDRSLLKLVIDAFLKESVKLQDSISAAITNQDAKLLHRTGHTLKGTMISLGAESWSHPARQLEDLGASGSVDGAQPIAEELDQLLPSLREQLQSFSVEQSD